MISTTNTKVLCPHCGGTMNFVEYRFYMCRSCAGLAKMEPTGEIVPAWVNKDGRYCVEPTRKKKNVEKMSKTPKREKPTKRKTTQSKKQAPMPKPKPVPKKVESPPGKRASISKKWATFEEASEVLHTTKEDLERLDSLGIIPLHTVNSKRVILRESLKDISRGTILQWLKDERLVTVPQAAKATGIGERTIHRWREEELIYSVRPGKFYLVHLNEVQEMAKDRRELEEMTAGLLSVGSAARKYGLTRSCVEYQLKREGAQLIHTPKAYYIPEEWFYVLEKEAQRRRQV